MHVDFVLGLVVLSEISAAEETDSIEMGDDCYFVVGFAILQKNLFHFAGSVSYVLCLLSHVLSVHELIDAVGLLMIVVAFHFFQKLKVSLLIFKRVVFDEPKLAFGFYF